MAMTVAVNIPHPLGPRAAQHDAELAFSMAGPDGVVYGCEIDAGNDGPFEDAAHPTHRVRFRWRKTQVAHPAGWKSAEAVHYLLTRPPLLWSNPGRDANVVYDHASKTAHISIHAPNQRRGKAFARLSVRKNRRYLEKLAALVARLVAAGWTVVLGGDFNDVRRADLHERQVVAAHAGLMGVIAVPAAGKYVRVRNVRVTRQNKGDHPIVAADVTIEELP